MDVASFLRTFSVRSERIMWFLGAGASLSAGIPTAWNMIWEFKRALFCSEQRVPISHVENLNDERVRLRIQSYLDDRGDCPTQNAPDEYSFYFERVYPSAGDRQHYIDQLVRKGSPSYGHIVLASLLRTGRSNVVWTTNFDRVLEDAILPLLESSGDLVVADLAHTALGTEALRKHNYPLYVKLHGDFQSKELKNIADELQSQDATHRRNLIQACGGRGLAVVGFSGRDNSIMDTLEEAIDDGHGYPDGLFWFSKTGAPVFSRVTQLIEKARSAGIEAYLIESETFDELMGDLLVLEDKKDWSEKVLKRLDSQRPRLSNALVPSWEGTWPVLRFNALRVEAWPATCRLIKCGVGGQKEVYEAIEATGAEVVAVRRRVGVLVFGSDSEVDKAFGSYKIDHRDLYTIQDHHLKDSYQEHDLLYQALAQAIGRELPVYVRRKGRRRFIVADPAAQNEPSYRPLKKTARSLGGQVPGTKVRWAHAVRIRLDYKSDRLWLLLEPTLWFESPGDAALADRAKEFRRDKLAKLYNSQFNDLIVGWAFLLCGGRGTSKIQAFGIADGVDASFLITSITAFSHRTA
ncbi:MAG: SIR2 family protein [Rhodothermales bacterium]